MVKKQVDLREMSDDDTQVTTTYGSRYMQTAIPKFEIPESSMSSDAAYRLIHDEIILDSTPAKNLATFCTTWMEPEADKLIHKGVHFNLADEDEYPHVIQIHERCINMLSRLLNAPEGSAVGTSCIGSSEAMMLAGLAMKWRWRLQREKEGKPADKPNLIMGENVQVCWEKFARYFDVIPKYIPIKRGQYVITPEAVAEAVDENTIGVCAILGSTFTGEFEPIQAIHDVVEQKNKENGWDIPLHIDGASGGFVAPFLYPDFEWDFRLPLVRSINLSGHKYGLVYPGVGWVIWRDQESLPDDLVFHVNYLGGDMPTFSLNFSRPASHVIAQYYNFIRLGKEGYRKIMQNLKANSDYIYDELSKIEGFEFLSNRESMPVVVWSVDDNQPYDAYQLSDKLRQFGWVVPAYSMPKDAEDVVALRIVVREGMGRGMAENLLDDIRMSVDSLTGASSSSKTTNKKSTKIC